MTVQVGGVMSIDDLARFCGYFTSIHDANNGYCCAHPKQEMRDEKGHGCCYSFSCPIAYELDPNEPDDLKLAGFDDPGDMSEGYWVQLHTSPRKRHILDSARRAAETRRKNKQEVRGAFVHQGDQS